MARLKRCTLKDGRGVDEAYFIADATKDLYTYNVRVITGVGCARLFSASKVLNFVVVDRRNCARRRRHHCRKSLI